MLSTSKRLQVKMKTKRVRARGTTLAPRGPMVSSTCFCTAPTISSHTSWNLPGTPLVAFLLRTRPMVITTMAATMVAQMMSASKVRPNSLNWGWTPGEMSIPSIGAEMRWLPSPMVVRHRPGCRRPGRWPGAAARPVWPVWPMLSSTTLALMTSSIDGMGPDLAIERATLAMRMIWNTANPARIPKPSWWEKVMRPRVTTVMMASRPKVLMASGRRLFSTPLALTWATEWPIIRKLRVPSPSPMQAPRPEQRLVEGDAGDQGGHADHQHHGHGALGHVGDVGQFEVGEHGGYTPVRTAAGGGARR